LLFLVCSVPSEALLACFQWVKHCLFGDRVSDFPMVASLRELDIMGILSNWMNSWSSISLIPVSATRKPFVSNVQLEAFLARFQRLRRANSMIAFPAVSVSYHVIGGVIFDGNRG
jgi:hypothetical protein